MVVIDTSAEQEPAALVTLETALDVWNALAPRGCVLREDEVISAMESAAFRVPGARDSPRTCVMVVEMFHRPTEGQESRSIFQRMLRSRNGEVHLLSFWRAFGESERLLAVMHGEAASQDSSTNAGLAEEAVALRDAVIRALDEGAGDLGLREQRLAMETVAQLVQSAADMSIQPTFWTAMARGLPQLDKVSWDDLGSMLVSWVREAAAWRLIDLTPPKSALALPEKPRNLGLPVLVHIYDVSHEESVQKLNRWLAHKRNPFKFGGVFHAGVEVNGLEWSFGMSLSDSVPGVACNIPREHPAHRYRQTVRLRSTKLSAEEVADLISLLIEEYPGDDYELLRRNCCHFADDFLKRLGVGRLPGWVYRLARVGAMVDTTLQRVANRSLLAMDDVEF